MSRPRGAKQIARLIELFQTNPDRHKNELIHAAGYWNDEDGSRRTSALMAEAKDIAKAQFGMSITPVYERLGWWTAKPTDAVMLMAEIKVNSRHTTELRRQERVADGLPTAGPIAVFMSAQAAASAQGMQKIIPNPERQDVCLRRIDERIAGSVHDSSRRVEAQL